VGDLDGSPGSADEGQLADATAPESLGQTLRTRREQLGIGLDQVERDTFIRARQLMAIEEDRFDALPGEAYARGFVRTYADYLKLDPETCVQYLNASHFASPEIVHSPTRDPLPRRLRREPRVFEPRETRRWPLILALAVFLVSGVVALAVVLGNQNPSQPTAHTQTGGGTQGHTSTPPPKSTPPTTNQPPPPTTTAFQGVGLVTSGGNCWIQVRQGSSTGKLLYQGTVHPGNPLRWGVLPVWIRLGAPQYVHLKVNGRPIAPLSAINPVDVLVGESGAQTVA
jgi:helix-turn-helix protein/uncharacterized protein DUF4115